MLLVLNREVGPIRVKYSPSCAYYYYELFLKDGSRSNDEDDAPKIEEVFCLLRYRYS